MSTLQKVIIASMYLELDKFVCYQWICDPKKGYNVSWLVFTNELIAHYGDINSHSFSEGL